jgi:hypothetical protein
VPGDHCNYENGCCFDMFTCTASGWQHDGCAAPPGNAICPGVPPVSGIECDPCVTPLACIFESCDTQGRYVAQCNGGVWSVELEPCGNVTCQYGPGFVQQFDKTCVEYTDCTTEVIAADCCGTLFVVGVNLFDAASLRTAWAACVPNLARCACPAGLPMAEDQRSATDLSSIKVQCSAGKCSSFVP